MHYCLCIVLVAGIPFADAADAEKDDTEIAVAVEFELAASEYVPAHLVDVKSSQGIVTLSGSVDSLLARDHAVRIAESIKGVRSVVNRITVNPVARPDMRIQNDVTNALYFDAVTDEFEIDASVDAGVVTLTGNVDSWAEKDIAEQVVKGIKGIRAIKNQIDVKYDTERPDAEIRTEIERRLQIDPFINDGLIVVSVEEGEVVLTGTVGSAVEKTRTVSRSWVAGVSSVDTSKLNIEPWAKEPMKREKKWVPKTDEAVRKAVEDALFYDPRTLSFDIDVQARGGLVTLRGEVDNLEAKKAAENDARNTVGVAGVTNLIRVRPVRMFTDDEIAARVRASLRWDPVVERHEISLMVRNAKVFLYGTVDSYYERSHAEEVVESVLGVVDVRNNLDVAPYRGWKSDRRIRQDIESQYFWSIFVDGGDIDIRVSEREATLSGTVDSWAELYAAVENAFEGGAETVRSKLAIEGTGQQPTLIYYHEDYDPLFTWVW
jgi:osmotically-inducible protein OsmY